MSKYFSESEFKKCVPSCSEKDMDGAFLSLLDEVRSKAGIPLVLNCAYRSVEWDKSKGRKLCTHARVSRRYSLQHKCQSYEDSACGIGLWNPKDRHR